MSRLPSADSPSSGQRAAAAREVRDTSGLLARTRPPTPLTLVWTANMTADTPLKRHKSLTLLSLLRRPSFNRPAPANAPTDASPFADQTDVAPTRQAYQTSRTQSKNNMREALQDVVVIPCFPDAAGTLADSDRCAFPQPIRDHGLLPGSQVRRPLPRRSPQALSFSACNKIHSERRTSSIACP